MPIYKYPIPLHTCVPAENGAGRFVVKMPPGARVFTIQSQYDETVLWADVNPANLPVEVKIHVTGTGNDVPKGAGSYVTTIQSRTGSLVLHYFLDAEEEASGLVSRA